MAEGQSLRPADRRGPIFIIGSMGSGTTLLRLILDSHPNIALPHETGFMRAYSAMSFIPFKWTGRRWAMRLGWSRQEFDEELRAFFERMFRRYADTHGKGRWGEKTPLHTWHVTQMANLFPDAVFVGIVRHPGAVTGSNMARFWRSVTKATYHYERYNKEIARQAAELSDRFVVMRYEELLLKTEPVMRELLDWLGEDWSDHVLQHHVVQADREHERIEGKSRADDAIDVARIDKWARTMDARTRKSVARQIGRVGEFFGYSMDDPGQLAPVHDRGTLLIGGDDLRTRFEPFADLDVPTQMEVPIMERFYHPRHFVLADREEYADLRALANAPAPAPAPAPVSPARRFARRLPKPARRRLRQVYRRLAKSA